MLDSLPWMSILKGKKKEGKVKIMYSFLAVLMCHALQGSRDWHYQCILYSYSASKMLFLYIKSDKGPTAPQAILVVITHLFSQHIFSSIFHFKYKTPRGPYRNILALQKVSRATCSVSHCGHQEAFRNFSKSGIISRARQSNQILGYFTLKPADVREGRA